MAAAVIYALLLRLTARLCSASAITAHEASVLSDLVCRSHMRGRYVWPQEAPGQILGDLYKPLEQRHFPLHYMHRLGLRWLRHPQKDLAGDN